MFCNTDMPMSMYDDGFHFTLAPDSSNNSCLVFLSKNYVLDTQSKFVMSMAFMFLLGVLSNFVLHYTSKVVKNITANNNNNNVCTIEFRLFILQIANGVITYILMLMIMTYSIEMLVSIALGEATGGLLLLIHYESKYKSANSRNVLSSSVESEYLLDGKCTLL